MAEAKRRKKEAASEEQTKDVGSAETPGHAPIEEPDVNAVLADDSSDDEADQDARESETVPRAEEGDVVMTDGD